MPVTLYFSEETHTLASMLRERLEHNCPDDMVCVTHQHPLDTFVKVTAPSVADVRRALLELKESTQRVRASLSSSRVTRSRSIRSV